MKTIILNCSKKLKKKNLLTLALLFCMSIGLAQIAVTGNVTDTTKQPVPGVNVLIKGTARGAATDFDGNFSIEAEKGDILVISYLGFVTQEIEIKDVFSFAITLIEDTNTLEEVVVVGYGTKSRTKLISAVSTVDEKALKKLPVANVSNALEGMASGLFVRQTSGEPGFSNSSFEVRNFGSALVIVDGAPGDLNQLDANEIESISVLKDAAAAAVYGVQGGNGVVLITTKKGKIGKPKLTYSNQFTYTSLTSYPDFLTSAQYGEVLNEGLRNANQNPFYTEEEIELFRSGADPINYPNTDWKDLVIKDWGFQQRHNLNLTGGTDKIKYFVSAGYLDQGSNYNADVLSYQQYNLRSNINASITDNLTLTFNMGARRRMNEAPAYSAYDIFRELSRALPTDLAYYPDGTPAKPSVSPNHIAEGIEDFNAGYYRRRNNNFDAKISLKWDINQVEGLSLKTFASLLYDTAFQKDWGKSYNLYTLNRRFIGITLNPNKAKFQFSVLKIKNEGTSIKEIPITAKGKYLRDLTFLLDQNQDIIGVGSYANEFKDYYRNAHGTYSFKLKSNSEAIDFNNFNPFTKELVLSENFPKDKKKLTKKFEKGETPSIDHFRIDRFRSQEDGTLKIVGERFQTTSNQNGSVTKANDIIVIKLSPEGKLLWQEKIKRNKRLKP